MEIWLSGGYPKLQRPPQAFANDPNDRRTHPRCELGRSSFDNAVYENTRMGSAARDELRRVLSSVASSLKIGFVLRCWQNPSPNPRSFPVFVLTAAFVSAFRCFLFALCIYLFVFLEKLT